MKKSIYVLLLAILMVACSEDFLDNPPEDALVVDNFFNTDDQVLASGSPLYGFPWFYFNEKFLICVGENYGGNATGSYSDIAQFTNFSITQGNQFAKEGWDALYNVVGMTNILLDNLETKVGADVSPDVIKMVKGEAYFNRASAYFYLVRIWGEIPLIHNASQYTAESVIYKNKVDDIYKFILRDYERAYEMLPNDWGIDIGRATKQASNAMMAKVYLTMKDYANAKAKTEAVMASEQYSLLANYADLFHPENNNNRESIFAFQWVANKGWGVQNTNQAYLAASSKITDAGDGWGTFEPSIDLQMAYEDGDLRRRETIMQPGDFYPDLVTKDGGYLVPEDGLTSNIAGFKKYVIGSAAEWPGVGFMSTDVCTNIIRYGEILLIHAEAILGETASTTDVNALKSFNDVRTRAGLDAKSSITFDDILRERRVELAVEGSYWFDLARMDRAKAIEIISNQERGSYVDRDPEQINSKKVTPTDSDFLFPLPGSEVDFNPLLKEPAVDFDFENN